MATNKELDILKNQIKDDAFMNPGFINKDYINDKKCDEKSFYIFNQIFKLASHQILTYKRIRNISTIVNEYLNDMAIIDSKLSILYYEYYREILISYLKYSIQNELWETCSNIRNFYDDVYRESIVISYEDEN